LKSSFSFPLSGETGGRGVRGEFRPPSQSRAKSVRIFSNTHHSEQSEQGEKRANCFARVGDENAGAMFGEQFERAKPRGGG